ncbi:hypothetical protein [Paenibacillus senegalimassiliensis]|uniref:hypothetical protein n=1 Tax=Paenibacillus senegalimassiliensis TaxID=1737426 RepID=UPI000AD33714|nr:hypothetical protein [Paenibacillus senegalimassiliensis]
MTKHKPILLMAALSAVLLMSACGNNSQAGTTDPGNQPEANATNQNQTGTADNNNSDSSNNELTDPVDSTPENNNPSEEILIDIDQTPKPIENKGSFDFQVKQLPEGYRLQEMQWSSESNNTVNTFEEAIEHGQTGEDGFYISGDGQFMGFFYPEEMKGEAGKATFVFVNEENQELTWEQEITLQ